MRKRPVRNTVIPPSPKTDCPDCIRSGGSYDMGCRDCVGRWLRFLRGLKAGEQSFQAWCKAAARVYGRPVVAEFLHEQGVRGYE